MKKFMPGSGAVVMSRDEVRAFDAWAINEVGIPGVVLMENAGRSCAELAAEKLAELGGGRVCVFCGTGNNGGDGYVVARHLRGAGVETTVVLCGEPGKVKGDAKVNLDVLERLGQRIDTIVVGGADISRQVAALGGDAAIVVDGLFGTGLRGRLRDEYGSLIEGINSLGRPIVAIDIPSGLDCDTGEVLGAAIRARWTVTFAAAKKGFTVPAATEYTGEVYVAGIGVEPEQQRR